MKPNKWDYKGIETAINGLTKWVGENTGLNSYRRICNLIIEFGQLHALINVNRHINMDDQRSVKDAADAVAKAINTRGMFLQFTAWVQQKHPKT